MAFELRHLRYFLVLADELHFGRAAKRLHMSQPPLSFNIKQLEGALGLKLLERNSRGVKLTPAGESFRRSAQQVLAEVDTAARRARDVAAGVTVRVRIGFVGSMLFRRLPEQLGRFNASHPQVQTELVELNSAEQLEALARAQIDLGFVHTPRVPADLNKALYMTEPFVLCTPTRAGAARRAPRLEHFSREPLVLFSRGASPDYYERVLSLCAQLGLDPPVRHEVRHWLSVVALVSKGMGYALVPKALTESGLSGVRFTAIPETPIRSDVYMVWNERKMPPVLGELVAMLHSSR
ncbi:LysR family transcriptional regulator [Ramlibacter alkalitolerans]|uniref:LysR family transcriptional regulator n=1 Tax=Ramlibacter alkalitolerans TaxID=2039631 RepID=A0ABS1JL16_9BURK|nr:LysR family transcriptional regulator [Ramlibacter alkalitolerans]MBL0424934.1 LysR family transcriptional regulator [Ramlibacter alkalitolerans]